MAARGHGTDDGRTRVIGGLAICSLFAWVLISYVVGANRDALITDDNITHAVRTELQLDGAVPPHAVHVQTMRGVVTLSGTVDNLLARERVASLASSIRGVRSVISNVEIDPEYRADDALEADLRTVLRDDPVAGRYDVEVSVTSGTAVLSGQVASYAEKQLAGELARGVRGLRMLVNEVQVRQGVVQSDRQLWTTIFRRLSLDARLQQAHIDLTVSDGQVTLAGTVPSVAQRTRAAARAWLPGVRSVDVSHLKVSWDQKEQDGAAGRVSVDDHAIMAAIQDALYYDPRILSFAVYPRVKDGVVYLSGFVDNYRAKVAAEDDARNTMGVWLVKNSILVRAQASPIDENLQQQVTAALVRDPYIEPSEVRVRTIDGIAYIEGVVSSTFARERVENVASRVRAVTAVINKTCCEVDHTRPRGGALEDRIKAQITWSPFVHADHIGVLVHAGMVTLFGAVASLPERQEAELMAVEAGAARVNNRIVIKTENKHRGAFAEL